MSAEAFSHFLLPYIFKGAMSYCKILIFKNGTNWTDSRYTRQRYLVRILNFISDIKILFIIFTEQCN